MTIDQFEEVATGRPTGRRKAGEEIVEGERDLLRIACSILVDRPSQKPIVIGKGGEMIKRIGTAARARDPEVLRDPGVPRPGREGGARRGARTSGCSTISGSPGTRRKAGGAAGSTPGPAVAATAVGRRDEADWIYNTAAKRAGPLRGGPAR